jgi:hypothetical protein
MVMTATIKLKMGILLGATLLLSACAGYGPTTVSRDRFDYTAAISESWKHQMLFNMVKLRYGDAPVFMDVSSVISQYQITGEINLGATISGNPWSHSETLGVMGQYVDRPTITFTPILGEKFARSLMAPIPPPAILGLIQAGYPVNTVFRMLVHEINGIRNRFGGEARSRSADPEFYLLLEKMQKIQSAGAVGMRLKKADKEETVMLVFRGKRDPATEALSLDVRKMLGIDPEAGEFSVVYGTVPRNSREIALQTRSLLEVLIDLCADIEVPPAHVEEQRVSPTHVEAADTGGRFPPLIRIRSSPAKPGDAFVSVPYRNSYFWIDDRDMMSKKIFSFLMFVFTLVETGDKGTVPVVTIPAG